MLPRLLIAFTLGLAVFAGALWFLVINNEPGPGEVDPGSILPTSVVPITRIDLVDHERADHGRRLTITDHDTIQTLVEGLEVADLRAEMKELGPLELSEMRYINIHLVDDAELRLIVNRYMDDFLLFDANHYVHIPATDLRPFLTQLNRQRGILDPE